MATAWVTAALLTTAGDGLALRFNGGGSLELPRLPGCFIPAVDATAWFMCCIMPTVETAAWVKAVTGAVVGLMVMGLV